jgi:Permease for cytosine/purines, uracil, thiamine, allantoin
MLRHRRRRVLLCGDGDGRGRLRHPRPGRHPRDLRSAWIEGDLLSFLRSIASCYWFAFQTVIGATAICAVLEKLTGTSFSLILVSVLFGMVQAIVAIVGYDSLKALSRVALPVS